VSILTKASKPAARAIIATIYGEAGTGKTSLAATFAKPIFIRLEDGMLSIDADKMPDALPMVTSVADLWEQLTALIKEPHDYKTVVIDSVTRLHTMFEAYILDEEEKITHKRSKSINQALGGYGAGNNAVAQLHSKVRSAAQKLIERGINVIFIGHSETRKIEPHDMQGYAYCGLKLQDKSEKHYIDDVDLVVFLKQKAFVKDDGKLISTNDRVLVTQLSKNCAAKNRYGITEEIAFQKGINPLAKFLSQQEVTK